ncbi:DUF742 domain-containing protein [Saccharopolyspora hordei]|uniref:DUF742 domain-containing protein n=1 Tax=Saccharopolyspora hordei TaxID=1838 RepID=A0A853ASQ5_9PSEU|nr:DUF742 domain-containing protein [Saccharopolyspora hordei]NYI85267.1 hypothetical protein [Saccharopolyspora hordei]
MTGSDDALDSRLVRPFSMRRGRTSRRTSELSMSTLVWTVRTDIMPGELSPEQMQILELCHVRHGTAGRGSVGVAIAELSAMLDIPLAVTKVLASELIDRELLEFSKPARADDPDVTTMKRVLNGLRELRV